jgi:hypothetical protein
VDEDDHGSDWGAYEHKAESSNTTEFVNVKLALTGHTYHVLVVSNATAPAAYSLQWGSPACGGSSGETSSEIRPRPEGAFVAISTTQT